MSKRIFLNCFLAMLGFFAANTTVPTIAGAAANSAAPNTFEIVLDTWRVEISPTTLLFTAKVNGTPDFILSDKQLGASKVEMNSISKNQASWLLPDQQLTVSVEAKENRLHVHFVSKAEQVWTWPILKENAQIAAFAVPDGEGLYLPVNDPFWAKQFAEGNCQTFHGGLSMPFFGVSSAKTNFAVIVPSDLNSELCLGQSAGKLNASAKHEFLKRNGLEEYEVIFVLANSSPIGAAKEYRKWLEETNNFVSLQDKMSKNPNIEKLIGATHAYLWGDGRSKEAISGLHDAGIDRMWLGYDQDPRSEKFLVDEAEISTAKEFGYLIGPYDTLDNIQPTKSADAISSVFDDELFKNGCVIKKDGKKMTGFAGRGCQLSSEALRAYRRPFVKERVDKFKASGVNAYFLDCDAFGDFLDDYDRFHPSTKSQDRKNRAERMSFISEGNKLVLGSEGGTAWATKYVAFLHGANDTYNSIFWPLLKDKKKFGTWWPPEGMGVFFKKVKVDSEFMTAKYSPSYRLPLFQTVFHDSVVSTERWELSLSKMPSVAKVRAIFWQLYNAAPIWNINLKEWRRYKDRIVEHHKFFSEIHRDVALLPITSFEWRDTTKQIQRIVFGDSLALTANFSEREFEGLAPLCIEASWKADGRKRLYCPQSFPE